MSLKKIGSTAKFRSLLAAIPLLATLAIGSGCDRAQGVKIGSPPPSISGSDTQGELVSLNRFKGSVLVLYFWTNSCCADGLKELQPFYARNTPGLAVLAINERDSREAVESFAKNNGLTFTLQTDEHAMTAREYGIIGFPTIFILDRGGIVREKILGHIAEAKLEKLVSRYL